MSVKQADLNPKYKTAVQLLNRKRGATVDDLANKLELEKRQARLMIDRLRRKDLNIDNIGPCRFKLVSRG